MTDRWRGRKESVRRLENTRIGGGPLRDFGTDAGRIADGYCDAGFGHSSSVDQRWVRPESKTLSRQLQDPQAAGATTRWVVAAAFASTAAVDDPLALGSS